MKRRSDDPVILAAVRLVETLAADPSFVAEVATGEIDRRIAAGLLIPAERLHLAPGLTLVPVGKVEQLEALLAEILDKVGDAMPPELAEAAGALLAVPAEEVEVVADEAAAEAPAEPVEAETPPDDEPAPDTKPTRPKKAKLPDEPSPCSNCGTEDLTAGDKDRTDLEQARLSFTRFRKVLCRPCMAEN